MYNMIQRVKCWIFGHDYECVKQYDNVYKGRVLHTVYVWRCKKCWNIEREQI
jgi:hypothetical protein